MSKKFLHYPNQANLKNVPFGHMFQFNDADQERVLTERNDQFPLDFTSRLSNLLAQKVFCFSCLRKKTSTESESWVFRTMTTFSKSLAWSLANEIVIF